MKRIILIRHATAVKRAASGEDFDRALRKRGRKEARAVAEWCDRYLDAPDLLLTSPAKRALETAQAFAGVLGYRRRVATDKRLYDAFGTAEMLGVLHGLEDTVDSVMVFGHDPTFTEFAADMAPPFDHAVPKCGVVVIDVRRRKWARLSAGDGTVFAFQHPRALEGARKLAKKERKKAESSTAEDDWP